MLNHGPLLKDYMPPESLSNAQSRMTELKFRVGMIQAQLGNEPHLPEEEYKTWRKKAKMALEFKRQELRLIRNWISDRCSPSIRSYDPDDAISLLGAAKDLIEHYRKYGGLNQEANDLYMDLEDFLGESSFTKLEMS